MQTVAWLEVTDEDWVLFIPNIDDFIPPDDEESPRWQKPYENIGFGGIAYAEEWAELEDWELLGNWETARRLDGSWETRVLIGQK